MIQEAGFLQPRITPLIKENQLNLTKVNKQKHDMGSKSWWKVIDKLTGLSQSTQTLIMLNPALLKIMPELQKVPVTQSM